MINKVSFLAGFGAGYLLGAKAGRERYDQITSRARDLWQAPAVQEKVEQAQDVAKDKAGEAQQMAKDMAREKVERVEEAVRANLGSGDGPPTNSTPGAGGASNGSGGHRS